MQGPGRGITTSDGTLVFAYQHQEGPKRMPYSGIIYSKDNGKTWVSGSSFPVENTTEAQVAEVSPGVLMLNMRNNKREGRLVYTTSDWGNSWVEHPSNKTLTEPVCMASLISAPYPTGTLLLFSNPDSKSGRINITIKASEDGGLTWPHSVLLDEGKTWGYSCLTMIDDETVGILYEGSRANLTFQAVKLSELMR